MNADYDKIKQDPNKQAHHTFGSSRAAECLYETIKTKPVNYRSAVRILHNTLTRMNDLIYQGRLMSDIGYWLRLVRADALAHINATPCDDIVKSLSNNIIAARYRFLLKFLVYKHTRVAQSVEATDLKSVESEFKSQRG